MTSADATAATIKIDFRFRSVNLFEIDVTDSEAIGEIRSVLHDHPYLKLHPNFKMLCQGRRISEVQSLSGQLPALEQSVVLDLQPDVFTNLTAERHVSQCAEFFLQPEYFLNEGFLDFNFMLGKSEFVHSMIAKQEVVLPEVTLADISSRNPQSLHRVSFLKSECADFKFFKSMGFSRFSPVASSLSANSDFLYLDVVTKEGEYLCVAVSAHGCYANESTELEFGPKPKSELHSSLFGLLGALSAGFKADLEGYVVFDSQECHDSLMNCPEVVRSTADEQRTFAEAERVTVWHSGLRQLRALLSELKHGINLKIYRDWNEEFQSYRSLPAVDTVQQLQKTKILRRVVRDFARSSQELAKAIVHNHFTSVNPTDKKFEECFVFNNLFITYAEDRLDWETPRAETTPSSYTNINSDLKNLQHIYALDLTNVNVINTCAVDYLGLRLVVQTMITGILHFDQKTWNCYGSIDDGKTFNDNQEFAPIFEELCRHFKLKTNCRFRDSEGREFVLHGSPEVKGIKAGDGRKYVMDLMKLSPRDLNFPSAREHEGCLVRQELIRNFVFMTTFEEMCQRKGQAGEGGLPQSDGPSKDTGKQGGDGAVVGTDRQAEGLPSDPEPAQAVQFPDATPAPEQSESPGPCAEHFNPNIGSMLENIDDGLKAAETDRLKALSKFLLDNSIPFFKNELSSNPTSVPTDMDSLVELMHKYGINVRYLGRLYHSFDTDNEKFFKQLFERTLLVRALRKVIRSVALEAGFAETLNATVHCLNLVLGDAEVRGHLDRKSEGGKGENGVAVNGQRHKGGEKQAKRKGKKKKQAKPALVAADLAAPQQQKTSGELLAELVGIAKARYGADLSGYAGFESFLCLQNPRDKMCFLREFCKAMGLVLACRNYTFGSGGSGFEYPLRPRDFVRVNSRVKLPGFQVEALRFSFKNIEQEISEKNFDSALASLLGCQNLVLNTYGLFNADFVFVTSKIASLYFVKGLFEKAIRVQTLVIKVSERVFGLENLNTAFAIVELSNYVYESRRVDHSITLHTLAVLIFDLVGGSINPSSLLCLQEMQMLFTQTKKLHEESESVSEMLKRKEQIFGESDERLQFLLGKLAGIKSELGLFKEASLLQARKSFILKRIWKVSEKDRNDFASKMIEEKIQESESLKNLWVQKYKAAEAVSRKEEGPANPKGLKARNVGH